MNQRVTDTVGGASSQFTGLCKRPDEAKKKKKTPYCHKNRETAPTPVCLFPKTERERSRKIFCQFVSASGRKRRLFSQSRYQRLLAAISEITPLHRERRRFVLKVRGPSPGVFPRWHRRTARFRPHIHWGRLCFPSITDAARPQDQTACHLLHVIRYKL